MPGGRGSSNKSMTTKSETPTPRSTAQASRVESQVPEAILGPIVNEAAKLANVPPQQLVIRAEALAVVPTIFSHRS
jgi:hypothetical protein